MGALAAIAALGFTLVIRWIGVYRAWQQAHAPAGPMPHAYGAYTLTAWAATRDRAARTPRAPAGQARPWQLAVPPERHFPVSAVIAHGILVTTVILVVLTVLGQILGG